MSAPGTRHWASGLRARAPPSLAGRCPVSSPSERCPDPPPMAPQLWVCPWKALPEPPPPAKASVWSQAGGQIARPAPAPQLWRTRPATLLAGAAGSGVRVRCAPSSSLHYSEPQSRGTGGLPVRGVGWRRPYVRGRAWSHWCMRLACRDGEP